MLRGAAECPDLFKEFPEPVDRTELKDRVEPCDINDKLRPEPCDINEGRMSGPAADRRPGS